MAIVAVVPHHERDDAIALAVDAAQWFTDRDHEVLVPAEVASGTLQRWATSAPVGAEALDLAVSIGGDGTMLRVVDQFARSGTPVLGVNMGRLGFLTEIEPDGMRMAFKRFLSGAYEVEERMLLAVEVFLGGAEGTMHRALNEAVIEKTPMGHTVRLAVDIDGERFITYQADGLIVATPTGSTAYSLSARGPVVAPTHRGVLLTPVSPHQLFDRSLVLEPWTRLRVTVEDERAATASVDGRNLGTFVAGDCIECTAAEQSARLVTFRPRNFHQLLRTKFGLDDR